MKKIIAKSTILFFGVAFLAGCAGQENNQNTVQQGMDAITESPQQEVDTQKVSAEEMLEFENPGNDEMGKKIEGMDSLINSTSIDGYDEDASGEVLSELE